MGCQAATHIDEIKLDIKLCADPSNQLQQHGDGLNHIAAIALVGGQHGVQAKAFGATRFGAAEGFDKLAVRHAVFGFFGCADNPTLPRCARGPG